jgi:hypothetical protein
MAGRSDSVTLLRRPILSALSQTLRRIYSPRGNFWQWNLRVVPALWRAEYLVQESARTLLAFS